VYIHDDPPEASTPRRAEVGLFDLGTGQSVSTFVVSSWRGVNVSLAGSRVLVSFARQLWSYALDGSDGTLLVDDPGLPLAWIHPSPDGRYVTVVSGDPDDEELRVVEVESGAIVLDVRHDDPRWGAGEGRPSPIGWIDGESIWVGLADPSSGHNWLGVAVLRLNGEVEGRPDDEVYPVPNGLRARMVGRLWSKCGIGGYAGATAIEVIDGNSQVIHRVVADGPVLGFPELAPDSGELQYDIWLPEPGLLAQLNEVEDNASGCVPYELEVPALAAPVESRRVDLVTGATDTIPLLDVRQEWYGDRSVSFVCGGESFPALDYGNGTWATPSLGTAGAGPPFGFSSELCSRGSDHTELRVGGVTVDRGEVFRVLGFIEVP